jgi:hypothetical protein
VFTVAAALAGPVTRLTSDGSNEHEAYCNACTGEHVNATSPAKVPDGVSSNAYVAYCPAVTVTVADAPPLTVSENVPFAIPVPVSGTVIGEPGSELVMVRAPLRNPTATGENLTCAMHIAPAARIDGQGMVTA